MNVQQPFASAMSPVPPAEAETTSLATAMARATALDVVAMSQRLAVQLQGNAALLITFDRDGNLSKVDMRTYPPAGSVQTTADIGATK